MKENRGAIRYNIHVPLQIFAAQRQPPEFHVGQLRDVSRTGILFHSEVSFEVGTALELAFCLPGEGERAACVLARASVKTLRGWQLPDQDPPLYGIAVAIDHIDFAQPAVSSAA